MEGNIMKLESGWVVCYSKQRTDNQNGYYINQLPLHPADVARINEWSMVFDYIESRIASDPKVEFEIVTLIPSNLEPTRGETVSFDAIHYAKLIYDTESLTDWDVTLSDGLEDE